MPMLNPGLRSGTAREICQEDTRRGEERLPKTLDEAIQARGRDPFRDFLWSFFSDSVPRDFLLPAGRVSEARSELSASRRLEKTRSQRLTKKRTPLRRVPPLSPSRLLEFLSPSLHYKAPKQLERRKRKLSCRKRGLLDRDGSSFSGRVGKSVGRESLLIPLAFLFSPTTYSTGPLLYTSQQRCTRRFENKKES